MAAWKIAGNLLEKTSLIHLNSDSLLSTFKSLWHILILPSTSCLQPRARWSFPFCNLYCENKMPFQSISPSHSPAPLCIQSSIRKHNLLLTKEKHVLLLTRTVQGAENAQRLTSPNLQLLTGTPFGLSSHKISTTTLWRSTYTNILLSLDTLLLPCFSL